MIEMPRKQPKHDAEWWTTSTDSLAMVKYLEDAGCYLEFEAFFMNCFDRIRHEFHSRTIVDAVYSPSAAVDELIDAAATVINAMTERLTSLDERTKEWQNLNREIVYSKSVLAREYHDFGEANRFLSAYLIEIADDPVSESRTQAEFLRSNYTFPFVPSEEE